MPSKSPRPMAVPKETLTSFGKPLLTILIDMSLIRANELQDCCTVRDKLLGGINVSLHAKKRRIWVFLIAYLLLAPCVGSHQVVSATVRLRDIVPTLALLARFCSCRPLLSGPLP